VHPSTIIIIIIIIIDFFANLMQKIIYSFLLMHIFMRHIIYVLKGKKNNLCIKLAKKTIILTNVFAPVLRVALSYCFSTLSGGRCQC
jgi:hypothetical protein